MKKQQRQSQPRLDPVLKRRIALWLKNAPRGRMNDVAEMLGLNVRTLRNWKREELERKKIGRPKAENTLGGMIAIGREWKRQGHKGSRPVIAALPWMRIRRVREVVSQLKKRRQKRKQKVILRNRVSVLGLKANAVHVLDATDTGQRTMLLVGKDRATHLIKVNQVEGKFTDQETIRYLDDLKREAKLPLVLATDNGSQFCSQRVKNHLEEEKIIHLRSQPRTPQHNGACEVAIRELKETLRETKNESLAVQALNWGLKRRQLGYKTAVEIDQAKKINYTDEERKVFYEAAKRNVSSKIFGLKNARDIRKAEREAILETLEHFKLVKLTRGDQKLIMERENIS